MKKKRITRPTVRRTRSAATVMIAAAVVSAAAVLVAAAVESFCFADPDQP